MKAATLDSMKIDMLRDLPDMIPVFREFYEDWTIRVFNREQHECRNYLSPNRRDFYKILLVTKGLGEFTNGLNTYQIRQPSILFIHPNDIISWRNLTPGDVGGYYVLFKRAFIEKHTLLKAAIEKFGLFSDKQKQIIRPEPGKVSVLNDLFIRMKEEEQSDAAYNEEAMQAYIQLLLLESVRGGQFTKPDQVSDDYRHIHQFFELLEQEASQVNYNQPIRLRTAKEFASSLDIHPNHLNAVLKKHTGENVSTHIKNRLLEEVKVLLLQTNWSLEQIAYSIGFAEQPNFNQFFKKNTGITPNTFRKSFQA